MHVIYNGQCVAVFQVPRNVNEDLSYLGLYPPNTAQLRECARVPSSCLDTTNEHDWILGAPICLERSYTSHSPLSIFPHEARSIFSEHTSLFLKGAFASERQDW